MSKLSRFVRALGPGLVTGASDDDPSGIATYSQVGAQFGFGMLWTMLFSFPFMGAIQEISGRIGRVTGHGIAGNIRRHYSRGLLYPIVLLLFITNTINVGVDLGAMGAALELVLKGSPLLYVMIFAGISLAMEIWIPYETYVFYLKWMTLVVFAYVAAVFAVHVPWIDVLKGTFMPRMGWNAKSWTALIAVLGTTISPYLFFWQASEEAEEVQDRSDEHRLKRHPEEAPVQLRRIHVDTYAGMAISNIVGFFIILTTAVTLYSHGVTHIDTAAQAAAALRPLAGKFAFLLFSLGIVGTGLLAVPVLAGSAAYAVGEALRIPVSLQRRPQRVKGFYVILTASILCGMAINFFKFNPIQALYWTAVLNGIVAVPVIVVMMLMTANKKVMGDFTLSRYLKVMGWLTMVIMLAATIGLFATI